MQYASIKILWFWFCRYHVPRSWLKPTRNLIVLFEETGGDPTKISLVKRSMNTICAQVSETHRTIKSFQVENYGSTTQEFYIPKVHLQCAPNQHISSITFASFGTPVGTCGSFTEGSCHASTSNDVLEKVMTHSDSFFIQFWPLNNFNKWFWPPFSIAEMLREAKLCSECN